MKRLLLSLLLSICAVGLVAKDKGLLLVGGCGWNKIAMIEKSNGEIVWEHPILSGEDCNDIEQTRRGDILYAYRSGARLIKKNHEVVWNYVAPPNTELYTATELPDGGFMLAMCGKVAQIVFLDCHGIVSDSLIIDLKIENIHNQFRQILLSKRNTFLIPLMETREVIEIDRELNIIRRVSVDANPFSVKELNDGRWLIGGGDAHHFLEIDPQTGKVERDVNDGVLSGVSLLFVAETIRLKSGNTIFCNWAGHSADKSQPQLIEVDKNNQIVWSLDNPAIHDLSTVSVVHK